MKVKTLSELLSYIRKHMKISGASQKKSLKYMGYFHGYKGYRYCHKPTNKLAYTNFKQLQAVYDFDMKLKSHLYPSIMFVETALKSYALECAISQSESTTFADIFANSLTYYKTFSLGSNDYNSAMKNRLELRNHIYSAVSREYPRGIVSHYYDKDEPVPIWAIFELITLGEFGRFISCMGKNLKIHFSSEIGINPKFSTDGKLAERFVFAIKDLRNAIAHNGTIFDTRFKTANISNRISNYLQNETSIRGINFKTIFDYLVLIIVIMKGLKKPKKGLLSLINAFEKEYESLRKKIPVSIYNQIAYTNIKSNFGLLRNYIAK